MDMDLCGLCLVLFNLLFDLFLFFPLSALQLKHEARTGNLLPGLCFRV